MYKLTRAKFNSKHSMVEKKATKKVPADGLSYERYLFAFFQWHLSKPQLKSQPSLLGRR